MNLRKDHYHTQIKLGGLSASVDIPSSEISGPSSNYTKGLVGRPDQGRFYIFIHSRVRLTMITSVIYFITINTFSNGCLGSHNDEERSEMRYVMRHAIYVSHQNFERILHYLGSMSVGVSV